MKYSIIHNSFIADENERTIPDGERVRVPLTMMDSVQQAVADMDATDYDDVHVIDRQEMYDIQKAELSNRWQGGFKDGDHARINGKDWIADGRENGKVRLRLRDACTTDAEKIKQSAYDSYEREISSAWMRDGDAESGDACTINGEAGRWRKDKDGNLVCRPTKSGEPSDNEFAMAGPLSDEQRYKVKDAANAQYEAELREACGGKPKSKKFLDLKLEG